MARERESVYVETWELEFTSFIALESGIYRDL